MLIPGIRLVERPGVLHLFDGRRVVSFRGDEEGTRAIRLAANGGTPDHRADEVDSARADLDSGTRIHEHPTSDVPPEVQAARELLTRLGLVTNNDTSATFSAGAAFASAAVAGWVSPDTAHERLRETCVYVWEGTGRRLLHALRDCGLTCAPLDGPQAISALDPRHSLVVAVASNDCPPLRPERANQACLEAGVTWLPVGCYDGAVVPVGPLMIPGQTACMECLHLRLSANVEYWDTYRDVSTAAAAPTPPALREWAFAVTGLMLLRWIANRDAALPGRLFTLAPDQLDIRQSVVYRVPRCSVCAAPDFVTAAAPWDIARDH